MLNASTKNCVLHCRACLRVKVPVVCGVFERAVWLTLVAASVASKIGGSRATTKDCKLRPNDDLRSRRQCHNWYSWPKGVDVPGFTALLMIQRLLRPCLNECSCAYDIVGAHGQIFRGKWHDAGSHRSCGSLFRKGTAPLFVPLSAQLQKSVSLRVLLSE